MSTMRLEGVTPEDLPTIGICCTVATEKGGDESQQAHVAIVCTGLYV